MYGEEFAWKISGEQKHSGIDKPACGKSFLKKSCRVAVRAEPPCYPAMRSLAIILMLAAAMDILGRKAKAFC
jgi:hypothetical protein